MNGLTYEQKCFYLPHGGELKVNASGKGERRGGKRSPQTPERLLQRGFSGGNLHSYQQELL